MLTLARLIASVAFGHPAVGGAPAGAQDTTPTLVAIARADGVMLPFAKFHRGRWMPLPIEHIYYEGGDRQLFELTRTSLTPLHGVMP